MRYRLSSSHGVLHLLWTHPSSPKQIIPESRERLCKIRLHPPRLMMNIMIMSVVAGEPLERVPRNIITAMIINGLDCRQSEQQHGLSGAHAREKVR